MCDTSKNENLEDVLCQNERNQNEQIWMQQSNDRERAFGKIVRHINKSLNLEDILKNASREIQQALNADQVLILSLNAQGDKLIVPTAIQNSRAPTAEIDFCTECYSHYLQGAYEIVNKATKRNIIEPCLSKFLDALEIESAITAPIVRPSNGVSAKLWGVAIAVASRLNREWKIVEAEFLQNLVTQVAIAIEQADLYSKLQDELTARKFADVQLQKNNERLMLANAELIGATRRKDEFLAAIGHELRTPLNAILGTTEILQEEILGTLNNRQQMSLATIDRSGQHLLALINELLDLAKIESGQLKLNLVETSVLDLCEASLTFVQPMAFKKKIDLSIHISHDVNIIVADMMRVQQILINLLGNAIKFTSECGSVTLKVDLEADQDPLSPETVYPSLNYIVFAVIDTGIGIAPADLERLFQPFVQIDSRLNRNYEGTGLGLSLAKQLAELHGGSINVTSTLGQGSCFSVKLPNVPITIPTAMPLLHPQKELDPIAQKILIVDNNDNNVDAYCQYLQAKGFQVTVAKNGQEGIKLAATEKPDAILMDIQMPIIDGMEAIRRIRENLDLAKTPIIALTALTRTGDREKCLEAGANEYLTKPVKFKDLVFMIQQLLAS